VHAWHGGYFIGSAHTCMARRLLFWQRSYIHTCMWVKWRRSYMHGTEATFSDSSQMARRLMSHTHTHTNTHTHTHTHKLTHRYIHGHRNADTHKHTLTYTNTLTHTPTNTLTHTHKTRKYMHKQNMRLYTHVQGWPEPYIYGVYTVFWQETHLIYGHIQCTYTVLANPAHVQMAWRLAYLMCTASLSGS